MLTFALCDDQCGLSVPPLPNNWFMETTGVCFCCRVFLDQHQSSLSNKIEYFWWKCPYLCVCVLYFIWHLSELWVSADWDTFGLWSLVVPTLVGIKRAAYMAFCWHDTAQRGTECNCNSVSVIRAGQRVPRWVSDLKTLLFKWPPVEIVSHTTETQCLCVHGKTFEFINPNTQHPALASDTVIYHLESPSNK